MCQSSNKEHKVNFMFPWISGHSTGQRDISGKCHSKEMNCCCMWLSQILCETSGNLTFFSSDHCLEVRIRGLVLRYQAMEYPAGAVSLLLINLIVHLAVSLPILQVAAHMVQAGLMVIVGQGIAYLSYPVIGWVTDVFLTRHAVLKCS